MAHRRATKQKVGADSGEDDSAASSTASGRHSPAGSVASSASAASRASRRTRSAGAHAHANLHSAPQSAAAAQHTDDDDGAPDSDVEYDGEAASHSSHKRRKLSASGSVAASVAGLIGVAAAPALAGAAIGASAALAVAEQADAIALTKALGFWCREVALPSEGSSESPRRKRGRQARAAPITRYAAVPINPYQMQLALGFESDVSLSDEDNDRRLMPPPAMLTAKQYQRSHVVMVLDGPLMPMPRFPSSRRGDQMTAHDADGDLDLHASVSVSPRISAAIAPAFVDSSPEDSDDASEAGSAINMHMSLESSWRARASSIITQQLHAHKLKLASSAAASATTVLPAGACVTAPSSSQVSAADLAASAMRHFSALRAHDEATKLHAQHTTRMAKQLQRTNERATRATAAAPPSPARSLRSRASSPPADDDAEQGQSDLDDSNED